MGCDRVVMPSASLFLATVVEYLAAKYLQSDDQRRASAITATEGLLRELSALLSARRNAK